MYQLLNSILEHAPPGTREAFLARGIRDYCNALPVGQDFPRTQVFVLVDGRVIPSDGQVVAEIARELGHQEAA